MPVWMFESVWASICMSVWESHFLKHDKSRGHHEHECLAVVACSTSVAFETNCQIILIQFEGQFLIIEPQGKRNKEKGPLGNLTKMLKVCLGVLGIPLLANKKCLGLKVSKFWSCEVSIFKISKLRSFNIAQIKIEFRNFKMCGTRISKMVKVSKSQISTNNMF